MFDHIPVIPLCGQVPDSGYSDGGSGSVPTLPRPPPSVTADGCSLGGGGCRPARGGSDGGAELAGLLRGVLGTVGGPRLSGSVSVADSKEVVIGNVIHVHTERERSPSPAPGHRQVRQGAVVSCQLSPANGRPNYTFLPAI